jgi:hypothetical protein
MSLYELSADLHPLRAKLEACAILTSSTPWKFSSGKRYVVAK